VSDGDAHPADLADSTDRDANDQTRKHQRGGHNERDGRPDAA
jgi:hypothetical protein